MAPITPNAPRTTKEPTMRKHLKKAAVAFTVTAAASVAGLAFAAWTSTATGSGTAQSSTSQNSTISAAANTADLYPGAVETVTVTITNPNAYPVVVTQVTNGTSNAAGACTAGTVTSDGLGTPTSTTALTKVDGSTAIAPGATGEYRLTTRMANDASDACKATTFTLPLDARLQSAA